MMLSARCPTVPVPTARAPHLCHPCRSSGWTPVKTAAGGLQPGRLPNSCVPPTFAATWGHEACVVDAGPSAAQEAHGEEKQMLLSIKPLFCVFIPWGGRQEERQMASAIGSQTAPNTSTANGSEWGSFLNEVPRCGEWSGPCRLLSSLPRFGSGSLWPQSLPRCEKRETDTLVSRGSRVSWSCCSISHASFG